MMVCPGTLLPVFKHLGPRCIPSTITATRYLSSFSPAPPHPESSIRHLLSIADLSKTEINTLISRAQDLKSIVKTNSSGNPNHTLLSHKTVAMLFNKRSTRTRVSTESAVFHLGGHPMFLGKDDIQLNVNESLYDTARVISSMVSCLVARVGSHQDIVDLARYSSVPVVNALSDTFHPCQALADLLTIRESLAATKTRDVGSKVKVAWVGDANNVLYDLLLVCARVGYHVSIATPASSPVPVEILEMAREFADEGGSTVFTTTDPKEAVQDADFIVTDTWISMGQEAQREQKLKTFDGYQVTMEMAKGAKPGWKFMHCLPRHQEEVDDEVFYSPQSLVFQEAENRKWAMIAVLEWICSQKLE